MAPLIPYVQIPDLTLVPAHLLGGFPSARIALKPFGTLVALGLFTGSSAALRAARRRGVSDKALTSFLTWIVISSFFFGHVLDSLAYYPGEVLKDPWSLLRLWEGLSSFGGFTGAVIGGFAWRLWHRTPILAYTDLVMSCFPLSWTFGRLGCSIAHDHPGIHSDAWYAVQYPGGGRIDLGLFELLITIPLMLVFFYWQRRGPRPWGFYTGAICTYYAPLRFLLDFLRERAGVRIGGYTAGGDPRYSSLTPAQWACLPLLLVGIILLARAPKQGFDAPPVPLRLQKAEAATSGANQ